MNRLHQTVNILILFLLNALFCHAQDQDQFTVYRFTSHNGLPQNSIKSMIMDDLRYIWMTTESGLVRYDGQNFKVYSKINHPGIGNERFRWIIKTVTGQILTDDLSGRSFLIRGGRFEPIGSINEHPIAAPRIKGIVPDIDFYMKIKSPPSLLWSDSITQLPYTIIDKEGSGYFVKYKYGLLEFENEVIVKRHRLTNNPPIYFFKSGKDLLYLTAEGRIFLYLPDSMVSVPITISDDNFNSELNPVLSASNIIWSSSYPEVYLTRNRKLYLFKLDVSKKSASAQLLIPNLPENGIITDIIYDDISSSYFIGTENKGLYIYKKHQFKTLINKEDNRFNSNIFYSQAALDSNRIYAGLNREASIEGIHPSGLVIGSNQQEALFTSKDKKLYYSVGDQLWYRNLLTGDKILITASKQNKYHVFFEEGDSIFVGSQQYIGYIKNDQLTILYKQSQVTAENKIDEIVRGPDGLLWFATCKGVFRMPADNNDLEPVQGLSDLCARTFKVIGNSILIGTYGQGYYSWKAGVLTKLPADKKSYLNHVHSFYNDPNGWLWLSTNNGLLRARWEDVQQYKQGVTDPVTYFYFGQDDGIINTEFNGGCSPPYLALENGYISYPTMEGLVWFNPSRIKNNIPSGIPVIDEIRINGKAVSSSTQVRIPPSSESVVILLSLPYYGNADNINLQYKLEGLNKDWVNIPSDELKISFTNLTYGPHRLQIRNLSGSKAETLPHLAIILDVEKRYFETILFRTVVGVILLLIIYVIFKLNNTRILRKNLALEIKIDERTAELQDVNRKLKENLDQLEKQESELKESIQLKNRLISVISHDIITPLKFISMVTRHSQKAVTDPELQIKTMQDIELASERLHNNASNILNWIKVQNQRIVSEPIHIALYELAEECLEPIRGMASLKNIEIRNLIPEETIIRADKNILSIILQNLLTNSAKYTEKGAIEVRFAENDHQTMIEVSDTGVGMTDGTMNYIRNILEGTLKSTKPEENTDIGNRLGYHIISDLLKYIQGKAVIQSHHGKGTRVTILIDHNQTEQHPETETT